MLTSPDLAYRVTGWLIAASPSPGWAPPFCSSTPVDGAGHASGATRRVATRRRLWRPSSRTSSHSTEDKPMRHVKVNGVEVAYEVVGRGEPILFIHGAHIADAMRPLVADPALDRFQRIRYHRRG